MVEQNSVCTCVLKIRHYRKKISKILTCYFVDAAMQEITKMSATLSYDRRAIEEDEAADFLAVLKALLEDPNFLVAGRLRALRYAQD